MHEKMKGNRKFKINDAVDVYILANPRSIFKCTAQIRQFAVLGGKTVAWLTGIGGVWDLDQLEHVKQNKDEKE